MVTTRINYRVQETAWHHVFYDSHSHMAGMDLGSSLNDKQEVSLTHILLHDYLTYLAPCCLNPEKIPSLSSTPQDVMHLLNLCKNMSTYSALREGIKKLHGFSGNDICKTNYNQIDKKIRRTYSRLGERAWQRAVMQKCNVKKQVHICQFPYITEHWKNLPSDELAKQKEILRPSLVIDGFCFTGLSQSMELVKSMYNKMPSPPRKLSQHEELCEQILDDFLKAGGKSIKLLCAYVRPLTLNPVSSSTAKSLFAKKDSITNPSLLKPLQDYLIIKFAEMAKKKEIPLLIHTGYSIPPRWADVENLLPLLQNPQLSNLKIALVHAGWPYYEKALLLARTFRNCWFDMAWLPLLSPSMAKRVLSEAIDILPRNKIMIGTDTGTAESFYGTVMLIRQTIAEVLSSKVKEKQFSVVEACRYIKYLLWENPNEFFNESK